MGGCFGWQWLWIVPLIGLCGVFLVVGCTWWQRWLLGVIGFRAWWLLVVYCNRYIILL